MTSSAAESWPSRSRSARVRCVIVESGAGAYGALSELTLVADGDAASETRTEMLELAEEVTASSNAELVPVRVRFGASTPAVRERRSGIFPATRSHS